MQEMPTTLPDRETILHLLAGPELDLLVATSVLGWKRWRHDRPESGEEPRSFLRPPDWKPEDDYTELGLKLLRPADSSIPLYADERNLPKFSEEIAAAWRVVEHLHRKDWDVVLDNFGDGNVWRCHISRREDEPSVYTQSLSAPEAMAKAALLSVLPQ